MTAQLPGRDPDKCDMCSATGLCISNVLLIHANGGNVQNE